VKAASIILGSLAGLASAVIAFLAFAAIASAISSSWFHAHSPGDPSAGDSAGWALIFLAPILLPIDFVVSVPVGVFVFIRMSGRVRG
jgi:hypothetical protein